MSEDVKALVLRAQAGNKEAFGEIYKIFFPKIYRFIYFSVRNKEISEDLSQSTFLRIWKAIGSYSDKKGSFQSYLFAIARNLIIDWQRKKKEISLEWIDIPQDSDGPLEEIQKNEIKESVWKAMSSIESEERHLVILRYFEELSYKEIGRIVGKNEGAVRVRLHRILKILKQEIKNMP